MKKQIFLLIAIFTQLLVFSQTELIFVPFSNPLPVVPKIIDNEPCSQVNEGLVYTWFPAIGTEFQLIANDVFVEPNEIFALDQIIVDLVCTNQPGIDNIDVIIWSDIDGLPNMVMHSQLSIIPSSQTLVGEDPFGSEVYETIIDLPSAIEMEGGLFGTTYWVQLHAHVSIGGVGWHATQENIEGYVVAVKPEGMGWLLETTNTDGAYIFSGDCTTVLSTEENLSEQIVLYPNPTKDIVHIQVLDEVELNDIGLYSLTGQKINIPLIDGKLNISNVSAGVYMLHLTTPNGNLVKKIVKE